MGRLTRDPEVRYTQTSNTLVASFSLAVNRRFVRQGEERQADFINCVAWNKTGEFVSKYFKKGQQVGVIGRLQTRTWDDDKGQKHYITEVIVEATILNSNETIYQEAIHAYRIDSLLSIPQTPSIRPDLHSRLSEATCQKAQP